jgi:Streptomyces sporulation and cell division protein, SsgA
MLHPSHTVTTPLLLQISADTGEAELAAELRYDPMDPFAVTLAIGVDYGAPILWVFGRDLLVDGVSEASGEGDITIEPADDIDGHEIRITLATDCLATMIASRDTVVEFLIDSFTAVPSGSELERVDLDAELTTLLG